MSTTQFVDIVTLRELLWSKKCRPSIRTLRDWCYNRIIPSHKIGQKVYFLPDEVRSHLEKRNKIKAKAR